MPWEKLAFIRQWADWFYRLGTMTRSNMALQLARLVRFGVAAGILLPAFQAAAEDADAPATPAPAPIVRPAPKVSHPAPRPPARPEAKLDPAQARQLYYLRKRRLEQIRGGSRKNWQGTSAR